MSSRLADRLRGTRRVLVKELASFGAVGLLAFVIQVSLFNALHDIGAIKANAVAMVVSTTFAYVGNRFFSFSHRARTGLGREAGYFFGINAVTWVIGELVLATAYPFGAQHDKLVTNLLNIVGIGIGTVLRFWAYKRFVFLHPDRVSVTTGEVDAADREIVDHPAA